MLKLGHYFCCIARAWGMLTTSAFTPCFCVWVTKTNLEKQGTMCYWLRPCLVPECRPPRSLCTLSWLSQWLKCSHYAVQRGDAQVTALQFLPSDVNTHTCLHGDSVGFAWVQDTSRRLRFKPLHMHKLNSTQFSRSQIKALWTMDEPSVILTNGYFCQH